MMTSRIIPSRNRGISLLYAVVYLTVLCGFCSLAVDFGRVQLAKTQLQQAADAASRYAVTGLADSSYLSRAQAAAADNKVEGTPVIVTAADVRAGNWDSSLSPAFSTSRIPLNAVEVTARRTAARGDAVKLAWASVIGIASCDTHAVSIAVYSPAIPNGFIGLQSVTVKNNMTSAGYTSAVNTDANSSHTFSSGMIGSNGKITVMNNTEASLVVLGPDGSQTASMPSSPMLLAEPIPTPVVDFSGAPAVNPGGVSKNLSVSGTLTLPGGSYYFTSITLHNSATLTFSGPATVYVDGSINFVQNGTINAFESKPTNLHILQRGAGTVFGGNNSNNLNVTAAIDAPQTALIAYNGASFCGRATFLTITLKNNAEFYFDESLNATLFAKKPITLVK